MIRVIVVWRTVRDVREAVSTSGDQAMGTVIEVAERPVEVEHAVIRGVTAGIVTAEVHIHPVREAEPVTGVNPR